MNYEKYFASRTEIRKHNEEVEKVNDSFKHRRPIRVPARAGQITPKRVIYTNEDYSFKRYYHSASEMLRIQAEAEYYSDRIILADDPKKERKTWVGYIDYHAFNDEGYLGCPIEFSDRYQPKVKHLFEGEKVDPDTLKIPDPFKDNLFGLVYTVYREMLELVKVYKPFGIPFSEDVGGLQTGTYGIFNSALQMRGIELFYDIYDDPEYVRKLINYVADCYIHRRKAWLKLSKIQEKLGKSADIVYDHGVDMISLNQYKEILVPVYERVKKELGVQSYDRSIEHCGHGEQVMRFKHSYYGINRFTNVNTSFIDVERLRHDLGDDVLLQIEINPETVMNGSKEKIRKEVKEALRPEIKRKGNLMFGMSSGNFTAPLDNMIEMYEAVREYGRY